MLDVESTNTALTQSLDFASLDELDPSLGTLACACQPSCSLCRRTMICYGTQIFHYTLQLKISSFTVSVKHHWRSAHRQGAA